MCKNLVGRFVEGKHEYFFVVFRVFVGLLFMQHGAQKLFGVLGSKGAAPLVSLMGVAGVIEFFGGLLVAIGLLTRLAAAISAVQMLAAYFVAHASKAVFPIMNGGELALLFFAASLPLIAHGGGNFSVEKALFKKELF